MAARVRRWRLAIRIAVVLLLAPLPPILYLSHFGFPDFATRKLIDAADTAGYCLELRGMRLDIFEGIVVENPRLFRKGILGPPLIEAAEITIGLRIFRAAGPGMIRRIAVKNGTIRRRPPEVASTAPAGGTMSFPAMDFEFMLENCDVQQLPLSHFSCAVNMRGHKLRVANFRAEVGSGERSGQITGEVSYNSDNHRFMGRASSDFDPNDLVPFLAKRDLDGLVSLIRSFSFPDRPPLMEARFMGCARTNLLLTVNGKVKARNFRRYGLDVKQADSQVTVQLGGNNEFVALCPLVAVRADGSAEVDLTINLGDNTVSFIGSGNADPRAVMRAIDPATTGLLDDYHIGGPAKYSARGFLNMTNLDVCNITVNAEARQFGLPKFVADECSFEFRMIGRSTLVTNLNARIFGGEITGSIAFEPEATSTNTRFTASAAVDKVELRTFAGALTGREGTREGFVGELSGNVTAAGLFGKGMEDSFDGAGELRIRNGNIFRLPLFGKLTDMLAKHVPGVSYVLRQNTVDSSFKIVRGKVTTDALRIEGDILSLKADGAYDLKTDQIDFDVELRFMRNKTWVGDILQTILLPVTKLFRVRLKGSLDDPHWDSVNF